jgi:energy-coupling factor transporter ATP-binding protein EcfA2
MLRQYSKTIALIIVAASLFLGDFAIELLAPEVGKLIGQDPRLKRLLWGIIIFCCATTVFLFVREYNKPTSTAEMTADDTFAIEADRTNRRVMLGLVRRNWVERILHKSLWNEVRLILDFEGRPDAVVRPCNLALRRAGQPDTYIKPGTTILEVYQHEQEALLLLGDPGSGKTTLLLEIAEALLHEAENNQTHPIPVLFNLSEWRKNHTRLDRWLVEQLNREYEIPVKIGKRWVDRGELLLLLDGLDEVAADRRAACVEAINVYRLKHQKILRPMVVCCRTREYDEVPDLRLGGAVVIQPLTKQQVDGYLKAGGKALAGLKAVLKDEPTLYLELFTTPLMLNVAVIIYEDQSAAELRRNVKPEERRRRLWDAYIERMFQRKQEVNPLYEKNRALDWLAWMGNYLTGKDLQKYLIEGMQPSDLPRRWQTYIVRWLLPILVSIPFLLAPFILNYSDRTIDIYVGMTLLSVCFGTAFYSKDIQLKPIRRFPAKYLRQQRKSILTRTAKGLAGGAILGVVAAVIIPVIDVVMGGTKLGVRDVGAFAAIFAGFCAAMGAMMAAIDITESSFFFDENISADTIRPNEGIRNTLRTAVIQSALMGVTGVALGVTLGAVTGLLLVAGGAGVGIILYGALIGVLFFGSIVAAISAVFLVVIFGGRLAFQHYLLRFLLWCSGRFPLNITMFLDWAAQRVLVRRVGGGW